MTEVGREKDIRLTIFKGLDGISIPIGLTLSVKKKSAESDKISGL